MSHFSQLHFESLSVNFGGQKTLLFLENILIGVWGVNKGFLAFGGRERGTWHFSPSQFSAPPFDLGNKCYLFPPFTIQYMTLYTGYSYYYLTKKIHQLTLGISLYNITKFTIRLSTLYRWWLIGILQYKYWVLLPSGDGWLFMIALDKRLEKEYTVLHCYHAMHCTCTVHRPLFLFMGGCSALS